MARDKSQAHSSGERKHRSLPDVSKGRNYAHKQKIQKTKHRIIEKSKIKKAYAKLKASGDFDRNQKSVYDEADDDHDGAEEDLETRQPEQRKIKSSDSTNVDSRGDRRDHGLNQSQKQSISRAPVKTFTRGSRKQMYAKGAQPKLGKQSKPLLEKVRALMAD